jgi:hypothetical protein
MSRLSEECGILNISQPYWPPQPVTGIALLYFTYLDMLVWVDIGPITMVIIKVESKGY